MKIPQDERFRVERARFALRFCCESCANFDAPGQRCALEYPTDEHRRAYYESPDAPIVFCKDFDLR